MASKESDRLLTRRTKRTMTELILSLLRAYFDNQDELFLDCSKLVNDPANPSKNELHWIASWCPCDEVIIGGELYYRRACKGQHWVRFERLSEEKRPIEYDEMLQRRDAVRASWTDTERESRAVRDRRVDWQLATHNDSDWNLDPVRDVDIMVM